MALVCAISGEIPEVPVISPVSGSVFERRLVEKHLVDNDTDPVNGEPLTADQLVEINASKIVRPRAPESTSIPALIKLFQDEWDATMLETFKLRQHVHTIRQELSHSLYQHDAACRVIARLTRERDEARGALATLQPVAQAAAVAEPVVEAMQVDDSMADGDDDGMTPQVIEQITKKAKGLSKSRKKRSKPEALASTSNIQGFKEIASHTGLHGSTAGITCMSLGDLGNSMVLTGASDKTVTLFDTKEKKVVATMKGHKKKITGAILHPSSDTAISSSADKTVKIWEASTGKIKGTISTHTADVTGISLHPTGDYIVTCSDDRHWGFGSIETGQMLAYCYDMDVKGGLSCTQIHPDGLIVGTGTTDSVVHIWDLKEQKKLATFEGLTGKVTSLAFSENGYYLAASSTDAMVKLFDLRKPDAGAFHTIEFEAGNKVNSVSFDHSGSYLAVASNDTRIYTTKRWEHLATLEDHSKAVNAVAFGTNAKSLYSAGSDRQLKVYE